MARGKLSELFYDIRANTEGLGNDLKGAETQLGKIEKYVLAHPVAAFGALSAAVVGVGIAATKMAAEVESGLRKVEARVPATTADMARLRDTIREISLAGPNSQATLATTAAEIARQGAASIDEVEQRLAAVVKLSDATGEDMLGIVAGLDQAMDLFGLSSKDAEGFVAKLFATAANRMPITDMFAAFQASAKTIRDFGIDADTAMRALGALLEEGKNAKQAASIFKEYAALGAAGAAEIRKYAASFDVAADAAGRLNAAQATMNASAEKSWLTIKNNMNVALIELGERILPVVETSMRGLVDLFDLLNGRADDLAQKALAQGALGTLLQGGLALKRGGSTAVTPDQRAAAMQVGSALQDGTLSLAGYSTTQLFAIKAMMANVFKDFPSLLIANTKSGIGQAFAEIDKAIVATMQKAGGAGSGTGSGRRTPDQIRADEEAQKEREKQLAEMAKKIQEASEALNKALAERSDEFWKLYRARLADVMDSMVDTTEKEFAAMRAAAAGGLVDLPPEFEQLEARAISAAKAMRDAAVQLDRIEQLKAAGHAPTADNLSALLVSADRLKTLRSTATEGTKEWKELGDQLKKVNDEITKILDGVANASSGTKAAVKKTTDELIAQAQAWQQAVDGALQLAEAIGIVDQKAANALRSVSQIVFNIPALMNAWAKRNESGEGAGFGGLVKASLPVVGAVASLVSGFVSAAKAAREHAEALRAARAKLSDSLRDRNAAMGLNDTQRRFADIDTQRQGDIASMLDLLIQQKDVKVGTRADFLAKDAAGQREILTSALAKADHAGVREALRAAIEQFDLLAESARKAKEQLEAELVEKRRDIDQSLAERRLKLAGKTWEADALAFKIAQEKELAAAEAGGIYTAEQLIELRALLNDEEKKYLADAQKRREEEERAKAQTAARRTEDLQTRINAADGESPEERARAREIEKRRELEDAMAAGADAATLALIQLAQAADDAAAAARAAMEAQREVEDLDVELLQLQGKTAEAERRAAELALQRRWDDAVAAGKDPAVLAKLAEVIAAKRAELVAKQASGGAAAVAAGEIAASASPGEGATSAAGTGIGTATIVQVDRMLGLLGTLVVYGREELDVMKDFVAAALVARPPLLPPAMPSSFTVGAGGQLIQVRVQLTMHFNGPVGGGREGAATLGQLSLDAIETGLANNSLLSALGRGQVGRS